MPLHDFQCPAGHVTEMFVEHGVDKIECPKCGICDDACKSSHIPGYDVLHLSSWATKVFLRFPMAWVSPEIRYDSPIDGRPITSKKARDEDLARSDCVPYDPELKKEHTRKLKEADAALEKSVDESIDKEIALMPARKKEKLQAELEGGITTEIVRQTVAG